MRFGKKLREIKELLALLGVSQSGHMPDFAIRQRWITGLKAHR